MNGWVCRPALLAAAVVTASGLAGVSARTRQTPAPQSEARSAAGPAAVAADFVALDAAGKPFADLRSSDLTVTVDGRPRTVRALHHVSRGPGAEAAAAALAARNGANATVVHAETTRTILIAVDEASIPRGSEKPVVALVAGRATPMDYLARLKDQAPASFVDDEGPSQQQRLRDTAREAGGGASTAGGASSPGSSLDALGRIFASWRDEPGTHTVVLVSTGFATGGARESEMRESDRNDNEEITCKAVYANYRRFQVSTEVIIKN